LGIRLPQNSEHYFTIQLYQFSLDIDVELGRKFIETKFNVYCAFVQIAALVGRGISSERKSGWKAVFCKGAICIDDFIAKTCAKTAPLIGVASERFCKSC